MGSAIPYRSVCALSLLALAACQSGNAPSAVLESAAISAPTTPVERAELASPAAQRQVGTAVAIQDTMTAQTTDVAQPVATPAQNDGLAAMTATDNQLPGVAFNESPPTQNTLGQNALGQSAPLPDTASQNALGPQPVSPLQSPPQTRLAAIDPGQISPSADGLGQYAEPAITPAAQRPKKTYLINGLLSAVPFIGFGFRNLKQKMPDAELYSYMGVVEGPAIIAPKIVKEAEAAYRANPDTMINLIGISLGADLITVIANKLDERGVPVNYLGIVDGTNLQPIPANVRKADNLTCSYLDCTRARARLKPGNSTTVFDKQVYKSSHIPLGNHEGLHARVIAQSNSL